MGGFVYNHVLCDFPVTAGQGLSSYLGWDSGFRGYKSLSWHVS